MKQRKIMVLVNLDKPQKVLVQNAINLASTLKAKLLFFYVRKAADVVQNTNQFSAIRSLTETHVKVEKEMKAMLKPYQETAGVKIESHFAFGNVKNEIKEQFETYKPDVVMLGKRSSVRLPLAGDQLTEFVLGHYQGTVLVSALDQTLEANEKLSLGMLSGAGEQEPNGLTAELLKVSKIPLKSFSIETKTKEEVSRKMEPLSTVHYVFSEGTDAVKNLAKYVLKNNVQLLCVHRENSLNTSTATQSRIKEVMQHLPVSLLMTGNSLS